MTTALPEGLRPSLAVAASEVFQFDRRCFELGLLRADGTVDPDPLRQSDDAHYEEVRAFLEEGDGDLFPGLDGFDFDGAGLSLPLLVECGRYHAGWRGARQALARDPELDTLDLLHATSADVLVAPPFEGSDLAFDLHRRSLEQGRIAPLGNGTLTYVVWGALFHAEYWSEERGGADARAAFVHRVLVRGTENPWELWSAIRVLQPPLRTGPTTPGRGIAGPWARAAAPFGFRRADLDFVVTLRDGLLAEPDVSEVVGGAIVDGAIADADSGAPTQRPEQAGPTRVALEGYAAQMLQRILRDLGLSVEADARLRRGSLPERIQYWRDLAVATPFEDFRAALLDEYAVIAVRADGLGECARLVELRALGLARPLDADEARELARLERAADTERAELVRALGGLLVESGGALHYAAVADTLAGPVEDLLRGFLGPATEEALFAPTWRRLGLVASEQSAWVAADHLDGTRLLPEYAVDSVVMSTAFHDLPGARPVLERVLEVGRPGEAAAALANSGWLQGDAFRRAWDDLAGRYAEDDLEWRWAERQKVGWCLVGALEGRPAAERRELLIASFESGRWRDPNDPYSWWSFDLDGSRAELLSVLDAATRRDLVERGLAPAALLDE